MWDGAANGIIQKLKSNEVKKGQVLSIDAHNEGPDGDAIFSAHYSKDLPDMGMLDIIFNHKNSNKCGWSDF
jgi:hypothetical protein